MLATAGADRRLLTYEQVAPSIATNPLSVGYALGPIQAYCLENRLAPLTAVVVGKNTGVPGTGFVAWEADDLDAALDAVAAQNWDLVGNPFAGFGPSDDEETMAVSLIDSPTDSGDVYRKIRDRGMAQRIFRRALLIAYEGRCAACGLSFKSALEAAHIVAWGDCKPEERLDVRNGLLLCATHHKLFDDDVFALTARLTFNYYDPEAEDGEYSDADRSFALALHEATMREPIEPRFRPLELYIKRRATS